MAFIFGVVTKEEKKKLEERGWVPESPESIRDATVNPELEKDEEIAGFYIDRDLFQIMLGKDWT